MKKPLLAAAITLLAAGTARAQANDTLAKIKGAGSITIAAAYGYVDDGDDPLQWNADYCVNHADEIWPIVEKYL